MFDALACRTKKLTRILGGGHAEPGLYGWPKRDFVGDAPNARGLAPTSAPSVPHAPGNSMDSREHRRSIPHQAGCLLA
jgi:hypothetical protein